MEMNHAGGELERSLNENYSLLSVAIIKTAAQDYESAYRRMLHMFGGPEYIPATQAEAERQIKTAGLTEKYYMRISEFYNLRRFFLTELRPGYVGGFSIHSGADPWAVMRHVEKLVDSGSSLRQQAADMEKKKKRVRDKFTDNERRRARRAEQKERGQKNE